MRKPTLTIRINEKTKHTLQQLATIHNTTINTILNNWIEFMITQEKCPNLNEELACKFVEMITIANGLEGEESVQMLKAIEEIQCLILL